MVASIHRCGTSAVLHVAMAMRYNCHRRSWSPSRKGVINSVRSSSGPDNFLLTLPVSSRLVQLDPGRFILERRALRPRLAAKRSKVWDLHA